jgi:O-antigen/teichoic acid export membrane protein
LQNLTVPGLAWQRAESRPLFYSLLSISNLLGTLLATLFLVGVLHGGVAGAIIANGLGYACIVACTLPVIFLRKGCKMRFAIARSMLAFGGPLVLNFVSYWILQLSDRYLLGLFTSLAQVARYTVAYTLGSVMAALIIGPFTLAWPTTMFTIAKREDAPEVFRLVFRWFSLFLLLAAFGLSLAGIFLLTRLFPSTYYSAAPVIPLVATSLVFYGVFYIFAIGLNIKRKTWLIPLYTCVAAVLNVALNLVLIPHYGSIGAAISTLLAYVVLAMLAYIINQRVYPIRFEIGRFSIALALGIALYAGSEFLAGMVGASKDLTLGISLFPFCFYGGCLVLLLKLPLPQTKKSRLKEVGEI